ncbi:hypothetical protein [Empedobacter sp.]|uniref:hypothetical protein n=2 Tax=Empedobacter TaxID=59734 RepID=UPI0028A142E9|nr:hypothetical protein [Empedobacter sp.]
MFTKIINVFAILFGITLFTLLTYIFYNQASKDLSKYSQVEGIITNKGIINSNKNSKIFFLKLSNYPQNLAVYKMTKNYSELDNNISHGDKVKVYFSPSNSNKNNLDIVQIEKENKILLSYNTHKTTYYFLTGITTIATVIFPKKRNV